MIKNKWLLLASMMFFNSAAMAYEAGDMVVKGGAITVAPNDSSDQVRIQGTPIKLGKVEVDSDTQLGITGTYMIDSHLGVELLAATPFEHKIKGSSGAINNLDIGSTKQLPPTLTLQYYPMDAKSAFQPYAGVGINYTTFFDTNTDNALNKTLAVKNSSMSLQDSWGWSAQIGADYAINEKWLLNAALRYIDIQTSADINAGGTHLKTNVTLDPWVPMVAVGYKF